MGAFADIIGSGRDDLSESLNPTSRPADPTSVGPRGVEPSAGAKTPRTVEFAAFLARHRLATILVTLGITAALVWPMLAMAPTATASQAPEGPVVEAQRRLDDRLADPVHRYFVLVEADDVLAPEVVRELWSKMEELRADPAASRYFVDDPEFASFGFHSLLDEVHRALLGFGVPGGLDGATDDEIARTIDAVLTQVAPVEVGLPSTATEDDTGWHAPALVVTIAADNEALGGGSGLVAIGSEDLSKEEYARELRDAMAGDRYRAWFVAADLNLTSIEQGMAAGPFIGAALFVVLLIVGATYRSYWAVVGSALGLAVLMVWLKGGSNLLGLENDQLLATLVPISMISFGVDSFFHSFSRYGEERANRRSPRAAFVVGFGSVFGALALAMSTDSAAFLSNVSSPIESVRQFGIAAAIAAFSAFVVLGIVVPNALVGLEERFGTLRLVGVGVGGELAASVVAAAGGTAAVLLLVFVSPLAGLGVLVVWAAAAIGIPLWRARRHPPTPNPEPPAGSTPASPPARILGGLGALVARHPWPTLAITLAITAVAVWSATRLEVRFEASDYLDPDSEFIVALDKANAYLGADGGEPATIYVEGDLTHPDGITALRGFVEDLRDLDTDYLAIGGDGRVAVDAPYLDLLDDAGLGGDRDHQEDLARILEGEAPPGWNHRRLAPAIWTDGKLEATRIVVQIPNTDVQETITGVRAELAPLVADLEARLDALDPPGWVVPTGSPIYRDEQLVGIFRSMLWSLPIALLACFLLASGFFRSWRYGAITTVPILFVVAWLYGAMQALGYAINVVTAVIGAVSVGIGIDYATHLSHRFQEELAHTGDPVEASRRAGGGTGTALLGSSTTSIAGFTALAFAPMPMFASYGVLTVVMIALALAAALVVLPPLLVLAGGRGVSAPDPVLPTEPAAPTPATGELVVGLDVALSHRTATRVVAALTGAAPGLRFVSGDAPTLLAAVGHTLRLAVVVSPVDEVTGLEAMALLAEPMVLVGEVPDAGPIRLTVVGAPGAADDVAEAFGRPVQVVGRAPTFALGLEIAAHTGTALLAGLADAAAEVDLGRPVTPVPRARIVRVVTTSADADDGAVFDLVLALDAAFGATSGDLEDELLDLRDDEVGSRPTVG
ncbi:MAG TPA: hypothetical protein ENK55_00660 [Actinobacteria bacterium]|nr:hypothetical protein [Actinomycetota bacterium]